MPNGVDGDILQVFRASRGAGGAGLTGAAGGREGAESGAAGAGVITAGAGGRRKIKMGEMTVARDKAVVPRQPREEP